MKLKLLIVSLAFLGFSTAKAQIDASISPFALIWGNPNVSVDFGLSEDFSVEATLGVRFGNSIFSSIEDYDRFRVPITVAGKYYFSPKYGADGFYGSLWTKMVNVNVDFVDNTRSDYNRFRIGLGIGAGYKVVSKGGIFFDIGAGIGRRVFENTNFDDSQLVQDLLDDIFAIMFISKIGVGYRFGSK